MKTPKTEKFVFEISVDEIPHTKDTMKYALGATKFVDYGIQVHAAEIMLGVLRSGWMFCIQQEQNHLAECKCDTKDMTPAQKRFHKYLKEQTAHAKAVWDSLEFVRMEKRNKNVSKNKKVRI